MVEPPESTASGGNPATLKVQPGDPATARVASRTAEAEYDAYITNLAKSGKKFSVDSKAGVVYVEDDSARREAEAFAREKWPNDPLRRESYIKSVGESEEVIDSYGTGLLQAKMGASRDLEWALEDAKLAKDSAGAARSYLDVEADKTKEITRQFKDFENRASLLYDLMADEQDYGFSADKHNFDAWDAQRELGLATMPGGFAGKPSMAMSLSSILRPSLPDYVRPDYRLNAAVGLPGPQGFDDPDYGPDGLPLYARGTDEFIRIPLKPLVYWPWSGRNGN